VETCVNEGVASRNHYTWKLVLMRVSQVVTTTRGNLC